MIHGQVAAANAAGAETVDCVRGRKPWLVAVNSSTHLLQGLVRAVRHQIAGSLPGQSHHLNIPQVGSLSHYRCLYGHLALPAPLCSQEQNTEQAQ